MVTISKICHGFVEKVMAALLTAKLFKFKTLHKNNIRKMKIWAYLNSIIGKNKHQKIYLETEFKHYGNEFVVNSKLRNNVHR